MSKALKFTISTGLLLFLLIPSHLGAQIHAVPEVQQQQDHWCWAGCTRAVMLFSCTDVAQCTIANYARTQLTWGSADCCTSPGDATSCNRDNNMSGTGAMSDILNHFAGIPTNMVWSTITEARVQSEIAAEDPFILRWSITNAWGTFGHFVVCRGYQGANMYLMDPWFGEGYSSNTYSWVVSGTGGSGDHSWTHTLETDTGPCAGGEIAVTSPNGGQTWCVGSSQTITWTSSGNSGQVDISLSTNSGGVWTLIYNNVTDDGSQSWTVPNSPSTMCLIRVCDADGDPCDMSDAVFTIDACAPVETITVTSPNGGESWCVGSSQTITWTSSNTSGLVDIELSTNSGGSWSLIFDNITDDGSEPWTVPAPPSTVCLVRICDADGDPCDISNGVFEINSCVAQVCFDFNDGTVQGWTFSGVYDESDNSLGHSMWFAWWDHANYPNGPNTDPSGDNMGSAMLASLGWSPSVPGANEWAIARVVSPDLSGDASWQAAGGFTVEVFDGLAQGLHTIYANLFVTVYDNDMASERTFFNGTAVATSYGLWTHLEFDWSGTAGFPTNYVVQDVFINFWFHEGTLNEGLLVFDDVCTLEGGQPECDQPMVSLLDYQQVNWADPLWEVQVEIRNAGPGTAKNVNVVMNSDIPWLLIPDPTCAYGDIAEGASSWGLDSYTFDLTASPGGSFSVWFDVTYEDDCGNQYRLRLDPEFNQKTGDETPVLSYKLGQNYPNPFNPSTSIGYQIPTPGYVSLNIYDAAGKLVRTLVDGQRGEGIHEVNWNGKDNRGAAVVSGIYFYKLSAGPFTETRKLVLLR